MLLSREKDAAEQERNLEVRWQKLFDNEGEVKRKDVEKTVLESALESWQEKLSEWESKLSLRTNYHGSDLNSGSNEFWALNNYGMHIKLSLLAEMSE